MKPWKTWRIVLFVALCVLLNCAGRRLAANFQLPLWLDSFGTVLCAHVGGPVCGGLVGVTGNIIYGMMFRNNYSFVYALTSVTLGVIVGIAARRDHLSTLFGTLSVASLAALAATAISAPLNLIFFGGSTGNLWGDGVIGYLRERGVPFIPSAVTGEFYIDFLDKLLTLLALALLMRLLRKKPKAAGTAALMLLPLAALWCISLLFRDNTEAGDRDYKPSTT